MELVVVSEFVLKVWVAAVILIFGWVVLIKQVVVVPKSHRMWFHVCQYLHGCVIIKGSWDNDTRMKYYMQGRSFLQI